MKRKAIATLLLCQAPQLIAFAPYKSYRLIRSPHLHNLHAENKFAKDSESNSGSSDVTTKTILPSRRQFLAAAAACLFPLKSNAQDLSNIIIGRGSWVESSTQSLQSVRIPPSFTTYLTRFIIHYDDAASLWWKDTLHSYSLLNRDEAMKRECRDFANLACSVERGLGTFLSRGGANTIDVNENDIKDEYASLLTLLLEKYADKEGAVRDIGLLFAMLPGVYQPLDVLRSKFGDSMTTAQLSKTQIQDDMFLLPESYQASYNPIVKYYQITPSLQLTESQEGEVTSTIFGPLSSQPLTRQRPNLTRDYYALLGVSGGVGCALTHSLVIPLDVVKTRMQTNPGQYNGVFDGAITISKREGISSLLLGTQATIVGYLWYGISVYPSYTFFKNFIAHLLPDAFAVAHVNGVALISGAVASIIASFGLTPIEAARIRAVAEPSVYRPLGLLGTLGVIAKENVEVGWKSLYAGLPSLMARQVIFGSVKFLAFERVSESIFMTWPVLKDGAMTPLVVSLIAGGIAGALSSIVSQPADSVLTYVTKQSAGNLGVFEGAKMMVQKDGVGSLFRGLGSRCIWAGCIIAGQFLLYDVFRGMFGITGDDLNQVFEITLS
ncbi:hypothetical protein ACHAWO_012844 [Cyclotella atomus]|uniref:Uncharacterized protein n=1 Tax=Cyclotella atomus TaxID=382360 RepID=A0ABD3MUA2_9STRA